MRGRETRARLGFSLIEMLVVIVLSTLVLGVVISLLVGIQRWDRQFRGRDVECRRLVELAEMIRTDVRQASEVTLPAAGQLTIVSTAGQQTHYELGPLGCSRTVESNDPNDRRTDLFAIGPASEWNVERDASGRRPLVKVTVDRIDTDIRSPRRVPLLVYGALGADLVSAPASE